MSFLIPQFIIKVVFPLIAAIVIFYFYYGRRVPRLHKKTWVLVLSIFLFAFALVRIYLAYRVYTHLKESMEIADVQNDTMIESFDGYKILIPAGWHYASFSNGKFSLIADEKELRITLGVYMSEKSLLSLEDTALNFHDRLLMERSNYHLNSKLRVHLNNYPAIRINSESQRNGIIHKDIYYILKDKDSYVYIIWFSCPKENYRTKVIHDNLNSIIESFTFKNQ